MPPLYVFVGGRSSRFGTDKSAHPVDGEPWGLHVARRLAPGGNFTLVGREPPAGSLAGMRFVTDAPGVEGPLAGLLAALLDRVGGAGPGPIVVASCDLIRPDAAWLGPLTGALAADPSWDAAVYRSADRWQPFPSVAHTRWLPALEAAVRTGARSWQEAFDGARVAALPWPGPGEGPPQANTPAELAALLAV